MSGEKQSVTSSDTPILIVDDSPQYSQVLRRMLQGAFGYHNITTVSTTAEAYTLLESKPDQFRLLFIDYNFPEGDNGVSLLNRLKNSSLLQNKAALLITSEPTVDRLKQAVSNGAVGIVAKPFETAELQKQIEKAQRALIAEGAEGF